VLTVPEITEGQRYRLYLDKKKIDGNNGQGLKVKAVKEL